MRTCSIGGGFTFEQGRKCSIKCYRQIFRVRCFINLCSYLKKISRYSNITLADIVASLKAEIDNIELFDMVVSRCNITKHALRRMMKLNFSPSKKLNVSFH